MVSENVVSFFSYFIILHESLGADFTLPIFFQKESSEGSFHCIDVSGRKTQF